MEKYVFKALNNLISLEEAQNININELQIENIVVLPYYVNNEAQSPCLLYGLQLLTNNSESINSSDSSNKIIGFMQEDKSLLNKRLNVNEIVESCDMLFKDVLNANCKNYEVVFRGLKYKKGTMFVVYHLSLKHIDLIMIKNNDFVLVSVAEILNEQSVGKFGVDDDVVSFFSNNLELCVLHSKDNKIYETPSVFYSYSPISRLEYEALFGSLATNVDMSPNSNSKYFLFGSYERTLQRAEELGEEEGMKYGVIRNIIFLNKNSTIVSKKDYDIWYDSWHNDYYDSASVLCAGDRVSEHIQLIVRHRDQFTTLSFNLV